MQLYRQRLFATRGSDSDPPPMCLIRYFGLNWPKRPPPSVFSNMRTQPRAATPLGRPLRGGYKVRVRVWVKARVRARVRVWLLGRWVTFTSHHPWVVNRRAQLNHSSA